MKHVLIFHVQEDVTHVVPCEDIKLLILGYVLVDVESVLVSEDLELVF